MKLHKIFNFSKKIIVYFHSIAQHSKRASIGTIKTLLLYIALLLTVNIKPSLCNDNKIQIISDIEMENLIIDISNQIFRVANMDPSSVKVYIISDPAVNAFVYQSNVFIHTGLITFSENTDVLFGVLAHETGHVARRHITRMIAHQDEQKSKSGSLALLTAILMIGLSPVSIGAMIPVFITPIIGLGAFMQGTLKYSRDKESEADQSAVVYLKKLHKSVYGLYSTMRFFNQEMGEQPEFAKYLYTHPLPIERMSAIYTAMKEEKKEDIGQIDCKMEFKLRRVQSKILGYMDNSLHHTFNNIKDKGKCFSNKDIEFFLDYKEMHKKWKERNFNRALKICDNLIKNRPQDLFLIETKASILISFGYIEEGIELYRKFINKYPFNNALYQFGVFLSTSNNPENINESIDVFKKIIREDPNNPRYYFGIAKAYLGINKEGMYNLNMSEGFIRSKDYKSALQYALKALKVLEKKSKRDIEDKDYIYVKEMSKDIIDLSREHIKHKKKKKSNK